VCKGKTSLNKVEIAGIFLIGIFLLSTFIISLIIGARKTAEIIAYPTGREIENIARQFLEGNPKARLGKRLDCSGFTGCVFKQLSIDLPASSRKQFEITNRLVSDELQKGDLVFFNTQGTNVTHVGIYLGDNAFIHSPGKNRYVRIDNLNQSYYRRVFISGGRINFKDSLK
jgi:hypothetical protein